VADQQERQGAIRHLRAAGLSQQEAARAVDLAQAAERLAARHPGVADQVAGWSDPLAALCQPRGLWQILGPPQVDYQVVLDQLAAADPVETAMRAARVYQDRLAGRLPWAVPDPGAYQQWAADQRAELDQEAAARLAAWCQPEADLPGAGCYPGAEHLQEPDRAALRPAVGWPEEPPSRAG